MTTATPPSTTERSFLYPPRPPTAQPTPSPSAPQQQPPRRPPPRPTAYAHALPRRRPSGYRRMRGTPAHAAGRDGAETSPGVRQAQRRVAGRATAAPPGGTYHPPTHTPTTTTPRAHRRGRGSPRVARARRSVACQSRPQRGWTRGSAVPAGVWGQSRRRPKSGRPRRMGAGGRRVEGGDRQRRCGIHIDGGGGGTSLFPPSHHLSGPPRGAGGRS